jgi:glycosyltransferase involved in cell wall biosynthesis
VNTLAPTKTLSIVVPCYNSADYMRRGLDTLVIGGDEVEILIVDDGSSDATGLIASDYEQRYPGIVRAITKLNGGHGSAVNTGIDEASGRYLKVVDSDDWVDAVAYGRVLETLRGFGAPASAASSSQVDVAVLGDGSPHVAEIDVLLSNFVYEKVGKRRKRAVRYAGVLPQGKVFGWEAFGQFRNTQYILMHSLIYRTQLLRDCGLRLPEHTFYVDNLYAFVPLQHAKTMYYLNVDFYRYFIGRADQSINENVMMRRLDQQLRVNRMMQQELPSAGSVPPQMHNYLMHYFGIICVVSSMMLIRSGTADSLSKKDALWATLRREQPRTYRKVRRTFLGHLMHLPRPGGRRVTVAAYKVVRWVVGFN